MKKLLLMLCVCLAAKTFAQAPIISYGSSTNSYAVGTAITPLAPINTGGTVPATIPNSVSTFAGNGNYGYADGIGTAAMFSSPYGISADAENNVYIADLGNYRVRKITPAGVVSSFAGNGTSGYTDGTGTSAVFGSPMGVVAEGLGNVYVADYDNGTIRKINSAGVVSTFAGNGNWGYQDGTGTVARFGGVSGVAIDGAGNVYVADQTNNRIRKITPAGIVTTLAGSGTAGSIDGTGIAASFNMPWGIATDTAGNVYVSDQGNNKIRKITPAGVVTTLAGSGSQGYADGTGTAAAFNSPIGITTDETGNVYVADYGNSRIRKITPSGVVSTLAGSGNQDYADGVGTSASFNYPTGVAMDKLENLYVLDPGNNRIRKITIGGYKITPTLPAGLRFDATTGIISGTPTTGTLTQTYTVTAKNVAGESSYTITIKVDQLPAVTTQAETGVTGTTATGHGTITSLGVPNPYAYGVCWSSTDTLPTTANSKVNKGAATATGAYSCAMTGLTTGTKYYVRAYATTDSAGTVYGNVISFTTAIPAVVSTQAASSITQTSAVANATLSSLGAPIVTSYGICWSSTNTVPTVSDNIINKGLGIRTGAYTCAMSNLSIGTTYYVRAYATNTSGTSYGEVVTFSTGGVAATKQLSVKIYLESILNGTSMNPCTTDGVTPEFTGAVDTVSVELHNATNYNTVEYRVNGLYLNTDGSIHASGKTYIEIPGTYTGSYYITVKTRNHLATTSASAVSFSNAAVSYDFTTAANKAYGSNMKSMYGGVFAFYAGDVNQDGSINTTDDNLVSDAFFTEGYSNYDLNGDGMGDNGDLSFVTANLGIVFNHP